MRRYILCYMVMFACAAIRVDAQSIDTQDSYNARARKYVQQYAALAIEEQRKNGIPAAVTLGQGILETEAGISELLVNANNHFGIKCKNNWQGETYTYTDDAPDECFKKYKCASDSYRDHSEHLKRNPRYSPLFSLKTTDYKGWAVCLKKCGYATNPQYATRLIQIIEDFGLEQYTLSALDSSLISNSAPVAANSSDYKLYSASYVTPVKDTPVKKIAARDTAKRPGTAARKDGPPAQIAPPATQQPRIIISHDRHTVKEGETVASIARMEGVDQRQLMEFNFLYPNEEPVPGTVLELQKQANHKPVVWINSMPAHKENAIVGADDKAAGRNDDYITIDRSKPAAASQPAAAYPRTISESTPGTIIIPVQPASSNAAAKPATPKPSRLHVNKPATAAASQESDPQRDQQLASMKAELDKVVYADDSKLMAANTAPAPATPQPARPEPKAPAARETRVYTVRKGDTAFSIAKKNNITVEQLMQWNKLQSGTVKVGQNLKVKE